MANLWGTLVPLIIGSAVVPIQIVVTILLLRSPGGAFTAGAWVAGMTTLRLLQGALFGFVFDSADDTSTEGGGGTSPVVAGVLLVVAVLLLVTAVRQLLSEDDPDAPPPKWMTMTASMRPAKAFLLGFGVLAIGVKFWVFTLTAIGAIGDADLSRTGAITTFVVFVVLAESVHLVIVAAAVVAPDASSGALERTSDWLRAHNRVIMIVIGFVFGTWFLVKALDGLGVW